VSALAALLALAKAFPAFASLLEQVAAEIRAQRLAATDEAIDRAVAAELARPWVCPARCPHAGRLREPGSADAALPKSS
jgi:hypothetical protein